MKNANSQISYKRQTHLSLDNLALATPYQPERQGWQRTQSLGRGRGGESYRDRSTGTQPEFTALESQDLSASARETAGYLNQHTDITVSQTEARQRSDALSADRFRTLVNEPRDHEITANSHENDKNLEHDQEIKQEQEKENQRER